MKLCVPKVGDQLTLIEGWNFMLHFERRNQKLCEKMALTPSEPDDWATWYYGKESRLVLLPADTMMVVDRVYIRGGASVDYNSLSFRIKTGPYKGCRFWAKLADVNQLEVSILEK